MGRTNNVIYVCLHVQEAKIRHGKLTEGIASYHSYFWIPTQVVAMMTWSPLTPPALQTTNKHCHLQEFYCMDGDSSTNQRQCNHSRWPEANVGQQYK